MKIGIIGGGIAGLAVGREAILNGFDVIIFEKDKSLKGASVNNGAVLHSGARYLVDNKKVAALCFKENINLKKIAPFATGKKLGIFLVEKNLDRCIEDTFLKTASEINMPIRKLGLPELKKKIRSPSNNVKYGYETPDVIVSPYKLTRAYAEDIESRGGKVLFGIKVTKIESRKGKIILQCIDDKGQKQSFETEILINCSGSELAKVAKTYGSRIEVDNIEGSMYLTPKPISDHFLTTCGINFDGNAIVPIVSASSIGSTWVTNDESESQVIERVRLNVKRLVGEEFIFDKQKTIQGFRTHFKSSDHTRSGIDYGIYDHVNEGIPNIYSVLPGKFVLHRLVAEEALDNILRVNKIKRSANSNDEPLEAPLDVTGEMIEYIL
jgi:glycerol-3-phosphate dehydrogenase